MPPFGKLGELIVGGFFLLERGTQEIGRFGVIHEERPFLRGAVPGSLVILYILRGSDKDGVAHLRVLHRP